LESSAGGQQHGAAAALAPAGRPRPSSISLRVLVDRSIVEVFAQGGRGSLAFPIYSGANGTALLWRPPPPSSFLRVQQDVHAMAGELEEAAASTQQRQQQRPRASIRVWSMGTGYFT